MSRINQWQYQKGRALQSRVILPQRLKLSRLWGERWARSGYLSALRQRRVEAIVYPGVGK